MDELENKAGIQGALELLERLNEVEQEIFWRIYAEVIGILPRRKEASEPQ